MIYSNAFLEDYSDKELETIEKVITLAEKANNDEYDIEYYISNLFNDISLKELINRLNKFDKKEKENEELVKIFEETFSGVYKEKYNKLILKRVQFQLNFSIGFRYLLIFIIPVLVLYLFLKLVLNPDFVLLNPLTYINEGNWSKLEFIFSIIEIILVPSAFYINHHFGSYLQKWINKSIKSLPIWI